MNGLAETLTGWRFKEAKQKSLSRVFKIINEYSRKTVENPVSRILAEGAVVGLANHTLLLRKNGAEVLIDDSGAPIKNKDGKITGVVLVFRDISERRKSNLEIARLASFPKLNPNPVVEVNFEGIIQYANPATEIMFPDIKKEGSAHPFLYDWKNIVRTLRNEKKRSWNRQAKIGAHWYYQNFNLVPNKKQIRIYSVNIDELKQAEEELRRSEEVTRQHVEELETLMDMIPAPIFVSRDPECRVITGNPERDVQYDHLVGEPGRFIGKAGYPAPAGSEVRGLQYQPFQDIVHPVRVLVVLEEDEISLHQSPDYGYDPTDGQPLACFLQTGLIL